MLARPLVAGLFGRKRGPLACVIGRFDLLRAVALAGVRSALMSRPGEPAHYSRSVAVSLPWVDPTGDEFVETLLRFGESQREQPVLFYDDDPYLAVISRERDLLGAAFRFVVAEASLVEDLLDKGRFQALAEKLGLPVPPSQRLAPAHGSTPGDVSLRFPIALKPPFRLGRRWNRVAGTAKALRVPTPTALRELWPRLVEAELELLAQELVPGPESRIESYHVYIDESGEIAGEFTGRKIRTYPSSYGLSTALTISANADVVALGREVVSSLGLNGVAKLDFKRAPDGQLWLLEVNPRFNLWHHLGAKAGVNLPWLVYCDLTGTPRPPRQRSRAGVRWCARTDARAAKEQGISLVRWVPWALACEAKAFGAWDDPMPFLRGVVWPKLHRRRQASLPAQGG